MKFVNINKYIKGKIVLIIECVIVVNGINVYDILKEVVKKNFCYVFII